MTTKKAKKPKQGHHECGEPLHYEQICGIRLFKERDGKRVYSARCPKCHVYIETKD